MTLRSEEEVRALLRRVGPVPGLLAAPYVPRDRRGRRVYCGPPPPPMGAGMRLQSIFGSFSPASLPGLSLWLNGRAGVTSIAGAVTGWADQSGNARDFNQTASPANRPTVQSFNGKRVLGFAAAAAQFLDATNALTTQWATVAGAAAFTIFVVASYTGTRQSTQTITSPVVIASRGLGGSLPAISAQGGLAPALNGTIDFQANANDGAFEFATGNTNVQSLHVGTFELNAGTLSSRLDGTPGSSHAFGALTVDTAPLIIGQNAHSTLSAWNGLIGEIVVYNRALSPTEIAKVEGYLTAIWGLPATAAIPLPGLTLWLNETGLIGGNPVATWSDQSGWGHDFSQGTPAKQPLATAGVLGTGPVAPVFTAASSQELDFLAAFPFIGLSEWTILTAHKYTGTAAYNAGAPFGGVMIVTDNTQNWGTPVGTTGGVAPELTGSYFFGAGTKQINQAAAGGLPAAVVSGARLETVAGGTLTLSVNGVSPAPLAGVGTVLGLGAQTSIGTNLGGQFFNGPIGELALYNRALTDPELASAITYLRTKWGI